MKKRKYELRINEFAQDDIEKAKEYYDEKSLVLELNFGTRRKKSWRIWSNPS